MTPCWWGPGKGSHSTSWLFVGFLLVVVVRPTTALPFHTGATETQVGKTQHLGVIVGCYKNLAWIISGWLHIDLLLVGAVMIAVSEHLRAFAAGLQLPAPCSLGGMTACPQNWLTEGYFPNDSGCSCPEMNDLLYFKWQADCFHSTLTPGSAAVTLFSGSGASSLKEAVGTVGAGFHLDYGKQREKHVSCRSKPRLVFDLRPGSWSFSAVSASSFLQTAQSLVRHSCWWAGFPTFKLSVGRLIMHKYDSSIHLLT